MRRVFVGWLTCTYLYWVYQNPNDASTFILQSNLSRILLWFAGVVVSKRLSDSCMGHTKTCICIVSLEICTCNTSKWITLTINNMLYLDHLNRNKSTIFADTCAIHAWQSWYTLSLHRFFCTPVGSRRMHQRHLGEIEGSGFGLGGFLLPSTKHKVGPYHGYKLNWLIYIYIQPIAPMNGPKCIGNWRYNRIGVNFNSIYN